MEMFLVRDSSLNYLVFIEDDPSRDDFDMTVEQVELDFDVEGSQTDMNCWKNFQDEPEICVGMVAGKPNHYRIFRRRADLMKSTFDPVSGQPDVVTAWSDHSDS